MDSKQILDALTSHIALYSSSTSTTSNPNPNPRTAILRWLSTLSASQRQSHLTILDPPFVKILLQMRSKTLTTGGPALFFVLPDLPSSSDPSLPTLCSRRSRGLLLRSHASDEWARSVFTSLRLFGSKEGRGECEIDSVVVAEELVADLGRFVEVMDGLSNGGFLRGEVEGVGTSWAETKWLKEKGYYSLESFVANRIELALRLAWREWNGGKKQKGVKVREKSGVGAGVAANVFWRKKGCVDWFLGLDPGVRMRMCLTFLSKGAKTLAKEIVKGSDDLSKSEMCFFKDLLSLPQRYDSLASSRRRNQLSSRTDTHFSLRALLGPISGNTSTLPDRLSNLAVLQQIAEMLLVCQSSALGAEVIFFSTLTSIQTIPDCILRRFRGFLMVISSDCVEFELTRDTSTSTPMKKPEQKSAVVSQSQRGKNKLRKRVNSIKKSQNNLVVEPTKVQHHQRKKECLDPTISGWQYEPPKGLECEIHCKGPICAQYSRALSSDHSIVECFQIEGNAVASGKDSTAELADNRAYIRKKRGGRKGARSKNTSLKKTTNKVEKSQVVTDATIFPSSVTQIDPVCVDNPVSSLSTSIAVQVNLPSQQIFVNADNELEVKSDKEVNDDWAIDYSSNVTVDNHYTSDEHCQVSDRLEVSSISKNVYVHSENSGFSKLVTDSSSVIREVTHCENELREIVTHEDTNSTTVPVIPVCECDVCFGTEVITHDGSRYATHNDLQPAAPAKLFGEVIYDSHNISQTENTGCSTCSQTTAVGVTSYEWPSLVPLHSQLLNSHNLPAATDRLHLDVGYNQPNHFHQSFLPSRHQVRNTSTESGGGHNMPSLTPSSLDWPPMVRSSRRSSQPGVSNYDSIYNSRLQSTLCTGITNSGVQFKGAYKDSERRLSGDVVDLCGFQNAPDMVDDTESHWMSDEETDIQAINGRDYSKYFGGGVMYWNTSDHAGTGFSRPPSHSSEDGSWAWYEADLNRAIDDMVGLPASYSVNGLASPTAASFCSPFETLGPGQQSLGYVISGNDVSVNALDSQAVITDPSEETVSGTLNTSTCSSSEGMKGDSLPYPILRPIIIPSVSRKSSRSEFKLNHDHRSPCLPSARRDPPRLKRPPSPVVLCVPRAPQVPPPSPVGDSRKHKGFPVVRSGSSSPRHWGMRNWYHEEISSEDGYHCMDGPEVVWAWGNKSLSGSAIMQGIPGSLLQDRLIAISQLGRDQEHPDVAFPVQPPELVNCPSWKTSLTMIQSLLHEEISSFCKKVATETHANKPFINWAVKRVARSLQVLWPRSRTNLFGSNATGLALPTSDVDLVVCLPPVRNLEPIKEAGILEGRNGIKETCLQHAARYLANQEWVKNDSLKTIENTAIPLIMLVAEVPIDFTASSANISISQPQDTLSSAMSVEACSLLQSGPTNLEKTSTPIEDAESYVKPIRLDISFKSPSHTGLQTTELVRELTKQFPASIPLALILKQFLADRSLDHSYSGGLSSYCLVLLITRFLQHEHHLGRPLNQNLGILLMDFLYFFGNVFDPRQMRVSIQGSGLYMTRERGHSIDPIHIDDPLCSTNNVGRNCFRIHQCIKAFADAYSALESEMSQFSSNHDSNTCTSIKLLPKIIPNINHQ